MTVELNAEQKLYATMIANALYASGIMGTLEAQISEGIKQGKVTIAEASDHKRLLAANAAKSMALGIEAALRTLEQEGYQIVRVETSDQSSDGGVGTVPRGEHGTS